MTDADSLKQQLDEAHIDRVRIALRRNERRQELVREAMAKVERDLDAEFPEFTEAVAEEDQRRIAYEDARLEAAKARVSRNNYGVLVEWGMRDRNWYNLEKRYLMYKTGRRAVLEVCDRNTIFDRNMADWRRPAIGEIFLRRIKKNGENSAQIIKLHNEEIPSSWLPEGDKPPRAADGE
jgi:hypothetical protein